jgi:hypothetical protein
MGENAIQLTNSDAADALFYGHLFYYRDEKTGEEYGPIGPRHIIEKWLNKNRKPGATTPASLNGARRLDTLKLMEYLY